MAIIKEQNIYATDFSKKKIKHSKIHFAIVKEQPKSVVLLGYISLIPCKSITVNQSQNKLLVPCVSSRDKCKFELNIFYPTFLDAKHLVSKAWDIGLPLKW